MILNKNYSMPVMYAILVHSSFEMLIKPVSPGD